MVFAVKGDTFGTNDADASCTVILEFGLHSCFACIVLSFIRLTVCNLQSDPRLAPSNILRRNVTQYFKIAIFPSCDILAGTREFAFCFSKLVVEIRALKIEFCYFQPVLMSR